MNHWIPVGLAVAIAFAVVPVAAATDYSVCVPGNAVCVVQDDYSQGDPTCKKGYLAYYGGQTKYTGVNANAAGASAFARVYEACGYWFYGTQHSWGAQARATAAGASADALWAEGDHKANPYCAWNAPNTQATYVRGYATTGSTRLGAEWSDRTDSPCRGGAGVTQCHTYVWTGSMTPTDLGCPLGAPPAPPAPNAFPYGAILP